MKTSWILLGTLIFCIISTTGYADRLPNQTPENQIFSIDSVIDATGIIDAQTMQSWVLASPGSIPTGVLLIKQTLADVLYTDQILTNGGKLSENKNFDFLSKNQKEGLYNFETAKVLTYASTEGAHLVGEEEYTLSIAGNYATTDNTIRCVFAASSGQYMPAFCNIVTAKSNLVNINSAQVSTKGQIRSVAQTLNVPSGLNYQIAVSPDVNSGSGAAEGTVKTVFAGNIMEARNAGGANYASSNPTWNKTSAENTWKDSSEVTGMIHNYQKAMEYQSFTTPTDGQEDQTDQTGTILIGVQGSSYYQLIGPNGVVGSGTTPHNYTGPVGTYQIIRCQPDNEPEEPQTLTAGGTISYSVSC